MSEIISLNTNGLRRFGKQMRTAGAGVERQMRVGLRRIADAAAVDARSRADWSTRIPGSIRALATARTASVRAGGARAPHAAPFEHHGREGTFRHPVFGNREVWVDQQARPFLQPAVDRTVDIEGVVLAESIRRAIEEA